MKDSSVVFVEADDNENNNEVIKIKGAQKIDCNMKIIPKGLRNLGNTCFFNSVMQCLMSTHPLSLYLDCLKRLEFVENRYRYSTKVCEKDVEVPKTKIHLPDVSMPLITTFGAFIQEFRNNGSPSPNALFNQICRKAPRFRGFAQQDAHELLLYLLDGIRQEEIDRFKKAFLQHVGDSNERTETNEELILQYRAHIQGAARPMIDAVFGGVLQQCIKCSNCGHISICNEPFLDLSLPILRPKNVMSDYDNQPSRPLTKKERRRTVAAGKVQQNGNSVYELSKYMKKKELRNKKKLKKHMTRNKKESTSSNTEKPLLADDNGEEIEEICATTNCETNGCLNHADNDADDGGDKAEEVEEENEDEKLGVNAESQHSRLADADDIVELTELNRTYHDLSELSVINSLYFFTMPELLSGSNAYICEKCCQPKKKTTDNSSNSKKRCVDASKRYLISKPPLILTLHLKRFEQVYNGGRTSAKKFRCFVEFGLTLDLAPFCSKLVKRIGVNQTEILYSLYGVISHSGDLGGGHYVAYVRARPQMESMLQGLFEECITFDPDTLSDVISEKCRVLSLNHDKENELKTENTNRISYEHSREILNDLTTNSKWYYISDSTVHAVIESKVTSAEAYILFYERIY